MEKVNTTPEKGDVSSVNRLPHSGKILRALLIVLILTIVLALLCQGGPPPVHVFGSSMPSSTMGAFLLTFSYILI